MSYPDAHTAPSGARYTTNDGGWIIWSDDWGSLMGDILSGALATERRSGPYGHTDYRPVWLSRTMKNQPGDWVAVKAPGAPGGYKPGKVVSATSESVTVELRFEGSTTLQTFDSPQPRIRWRRQNGRSRWTFA